MFDADPSTTIIVPFSDAAADLQIVYEERWQQAFRAERQGAVEEAIGLWWEVEELRRQLQRCVH